MASSTGNAFNPLDQNMIVPSPNGTTSVAIPIAVTREFQLQALSGAINEGSQLGAATILIICLFVITKPAKRRSLVFILNLLSLVLVVVRGVVWCVMYTGPFYNWYRFEMAYYGGVEQGQQISTCGAIASFMLPSILQLSLFLQVRIVCCTLARWQRHLINIFNGFIDFSAITVRLALTILTIKWNVWELEDQTIWQQDHLERLSLATNIVFVVSVGISAAVFSGKLAFAIRRRRSMGMTKFGPMQIIFIMGCQTMLLPLVFITITLCGSIVQIQTFSPTIVALCLPLSSVWATANANNVPIANPGPEMQAAVPVERKDFASGKSYDRSSGTNDTFFSSGSMTPIKEIEFCRVSSPDLELQKISDGVLAVGSSSNDIEAQK